MPVAAAVPAIIGAGGSIAGGLLGSSAAKKAAAQQAAAQQKVIDTTNAAVDQGKTDISSGAEGAGAQLSDAVKQILQLYQPYIESGGSSLTSLGQLTSDTGPLAQKFSFNPTDLQNDPGYAFTLSEGQKAINRSAAAKGGLFSSSTLKSLGAYTTGTADQYFNDAFNRAASTFNMNRQTALDRVNTLQGLAQLGYGATSQGAGAVGNAASQTASILQRRGEDLSNLGLSGADIVGRAITGQGNANAAGTMGSANAWSGAISNGTKAITDWLAGRNANNGSGGGFTPYSSGKTFSAPSYLPTPPDINAFDPNRAALGVPLGGAY